jgi:hypothetical protein
MGLPTVDALGHRFVTHMLPGLACALPGRLRKGASWSLCGGRLSERRPAAFHERRLIPFKVVGPHFPRLNAEAQTMALSAASRSPRYSRL